MFTVCMDMHTDSVLGVVTRMAVVDTGRRRRWTLEEKRRIVVESLAGYRQASATARRHGIPTSLLFKWRRDLQGVSAKGSPEPPTFLPVQLADAAATAERLEIVLCNGRRVLVGATFPADRLVVLLRAVETP